MISGNITSNKKEEFYQLAVHYVVKSEEKYVSPSFIQHLSLPIGAGTWRMGLTYQECNEIFARMEKEKIIEKLPMYIGVYRIV